MSFNDSNLSVCKLPTSTVYIKIFSDFIEPTERLTVGKDRVGLCQRAVGQIFFLCRHRRHGAAASLNLLFTISFTGFTLEIGPINVPIQVVKKPSPSSPICRYFQLNSCSGSTFEALMLGSLPLWLV